MATPSLRRSGEPRIHTYLVLLLLLRGSDYLGSAQQESRDSVQSVPLRELYRHPPVLRYRMPVFWGAPNGCELGSGTYQVILPGVCKPQ